MAKSWRNHAKTPSNRSQHIFQVYRVERKIRNRISNKNYVTESKELKKNRVFFRVEDIIRRSDEDEENYLNSICYND
jgi:hypothetical protein